jgi:hypothetical protein
MQPFSCQHREQHISKRNNEITVVQEMIYKDGRHLELVFFPILKYIYIWDLGLRFGKFLLNHAIYVISMKQMNFHYIFSQL